MYRFFLAISLISVIIFVVAEITGYLPIPFDSRATEYSSSKLQGEHRIINLQDRKDRLELPKYIDLNVGDTIAVVKKDDEVTHLRVDSVKIDNPSFSVPRTEVRLSVGQKVYYAYCGMKNRKRGGVAPIDIDGVMVGIEVTKLLFEDMDGGSSPFNTYKALKLDKDVRLSVWSRSKGIMPGVQGKFVIKQKQWSREKFGNWLQRTNYGIHCGIDIFATENLVPQEVISPVDGTVYRVYNKDKDMKKSKVVNLYGDAIAGPNGEKVFYRFIHLSKIMVSNGENVKAGQVIGYTGHSGFDARIGDHLHFEIRLNPSHFGLPKNNDIFKSIPVNPYYYLLDWHENIGKAAENSRGSLTSPFSG